MCVHHNACVCVCVSQHITRACVCTCTHTHTHTHTHTGVSITPCLAPLSLLSPFLPTRCPVCTPSLRALKLTSHYSAHYAATTLTASADATLCLSSSEEGQQRQHLFVVADGVRLT